MKSKPIAVLISDVHYSVPTLALADAATRQAVFTANELEVPLVVAGDLHDTKANLRGECVNAMLETFSFCQILPIIIPGNHDRLNEKAPAHALNFLESMSHIVEEPEYLVEIDSWVIPYQHDPAEMREILSFIKPGSRIIMHQGLKGTNSGDYIQDKSAIEHADVADFRVISGHYHTRQDIKTGRPQKDTVGLFSYIGNPYTLNYAEANDPPKGFQILMDDGTLEFVPTNLRKHVIIELEIDTDFWRCSEYSLKDDANLVRVKVTGPADIIQRHNKQSISDFLGLKNFRLDLIPTDQVTDAPQVQNLPKDQALDGMIDSLTETSVEQKARLKQLWRDLK